MSTHLTVVNIKLETRTESTPEWVDPTTAITVSVLVGVPVLVALYFVIGGLRKAFGPKAREQATSQKYTADDEHKANVEWQRRAERSASTKIDMPNDELNVHAFTKRSRSTVTAFEIIKN